MHNFKKAGKVIACIIVFFLILKLIDTALYPCTFMRNDIHTVTSNERDVIILGTSHGKMGLDPDALLEGTGKTGHNLCVGGEYPVDSYYLAKLVAEKQKPKQIIYELDPGYFTMAKEQGNNYLLFSHEFPASITKLQYYKDIMLTCDFRSVLFPSYEYPLSYELPRIPKTFMQKVTGKYEASEFKSATQEYHENGFIERFPVDTTQLKEVELVEFDRTKVNEENLEYLGRLISFCEEQGIELTVITMPVPAATLVKYQEGYSDASDYFRTYFTEAGLPYYDFNVEYYDTFSHDLTSYTDYDGHMNGENARAYSSVLGEMLFK